MAGYISMDSVSDIKLNGVDVEKIAQGVNTLWEKNVIEPFNVKNISQSVATVDWNTGADNRNLQYSEDKTNWTSVPYADGKYTLTIPVGKKYYVQGSSTNFGGWWGSDQDVEISGYVLSLHYPTMEQPSNQGVSYQHLFSKNKNGTADSKLHFNFARLKLPVRRCNGYAYDCAFKGCLSITELNYDIFYTDSTITTNQNNFQYMFQNCTNLRRVDGFTFARFTNFGAWSELNGTFQGCTSLEYVWDGLFDTTVTPSTSYYRDVTCSNMFSNCTSLVHPPKLPAVRGSNTFSNMFANCTSLTNETTQRILPNYNGIGTQGGEYAYPSKFKGMFYGCTGLTSMHDLSSYTMGSYGNAYFHQMYYGCTGITSIDTAKMPGGVATKNCFREMFRGCTGITSVPSGFIKPTNTAESCYQDMFRECTGLTTIPSVLLPSTTLSKSCYAYMFYGCNHLTAIPTGFMSPTTVAESCCQSMFENCSALTTIPSGILPALTMAKNCYHSMFRSCTVLANVPYDLLPATTVAEGCYTLMFQYSNHGFTGLHLGAINLGTSAFANWMFFDCPISQLEVDFTEWTAATTEWVLRTSNRGTFTKYTTLPEIYDTSHIPVGWTIVNKTLPLYFEDRSGAANTITCTKMGDQAEWLSLEYSTDNITWSTYDLTQTLTIPANGRVYLRGSNTYGFGKTNSDYHTFTCSGNYALGGDLFSILDDSLFAYPSRFGNKTFYQSTTLVDISQLDFGSKKILATDFIQMFGDCTSLVSLPNTIEVSYASTIDFSTHTSQFTQMFQYDPIANFPTFPNINTIGRDGMYCMNQSLDGSPNTSLEFVDLSNITTLYYRGLRRAFRNASALEVVKIGISAWPDFVDTSASDYNATSEWLYGVHSTGVFCKNSTLPVMRGDNYIPNNWSIADLNGKLYDPVITNTNNTITIAEGGGGSSSTIYYTTDGTDPDTTSNVYSQPFSVAGGTTIKAFADYTPTGSGVPQITHSNITTYTVPAAQVCATPNMFYSDNLNECDQPNGSGLVELTCDTYGATIYCKTWSNIDTEPLEWEEYTDPFDMYYVAEVDYYNLKTYATASGYTDSQTMTTTFSVSEEEPCEEPGDPCQDCIDGCEGDPDCEQECYDTVC